MLRFITISPKFAAQASKISIHLMLRFIVSAVGLDHIWYKFQYISCYGLSKAFAVCYYDFAISIHLMLRFICQYLNVSADYLLFQYISCYGLSILSAAVYHSVMISIHLMLRFINVGSCIFQQFCWFQYISCYGLSNKCTYSGNEVTIFQYISCYGLSGKLHHTRSDRTHFNTSHVTVYRRSHSILRYITQFQYISCYGLSFSAATEARKRKISIHLMLRFIHHTAPWHPRT